MAQAKNIDTEGAPCYGQWLSIRLHTKPQAGRQSIKGLDPVKKHGFLFAGDGAPAQGSLGSLLLMLTSRALDLITAVILARTLGPASFGIYVFFLTIAQFLKIPASLGAPQLFVRDIAVYLATRQWNLARGMVKWSFRTTLIISTIITSGALLISSLAMGQTDRPEIHVFWVALLLVPLSALLESRSAILRGANFILLSQFPMSVLRALVVIGCIFLFQAGGTAPFSIVSAMACQVIGTGTALCLILIYLWMLMPEEVKQGRPEFRTTIWLKSAWQLTGVTIFVIALQHSPIFFLGLLRDAESVGIYRVAQRCADLINFGLMGVGMAMGPTLSRLYTWDETVRLQRLMIQINLITTLLAMAIALVFIIEGPRIIPAIFGPAYAATYLPLIVLIVGYFFSIAMGAAGLILIMSGNEHTVTRGTAMAVLINILLNIIFIPLWGSAGAAAAFSASLVVCNIYLVMCLYRKTGLISTLFFYKKVLYRGDINGRNTTHTKT